MTLNLRNLRAHVQTEVNQYIFNVHLIEAFFNTLRIYRYTLLAVDLSVHHVLKCSEEMLGSGETQVLTPAKKLDDLIRLAELCVDLLRQYEEFYAEVKSIDFRFLSLLFSYFKWIFFIGGESWGSKL